jgi:8-oxo-dGTP diphosphatase
MSKSHFNFFAAVYLIVRKEGKILLLRRFNTGWMDGMYTLPAGHIDGNETPQEAMSREAKEEINIDVLPEDLSVVHIMHRKSVDREYFDFFLEVKKFTGEVRNNEENKCDHCDWFPVDSLPENTLEYISTALKLAEKNEYFSSFGF